MQPHDHAVSGDSNVIWILKIGAVWLAERLSALFANVTASDIATYLAIVYTSLMIVTHIRKEWLPKRRKAPPFAPTSPETR